MVVGSRLIAGRCVSSEIIDCARLPTKVYHIIVTMKTRSSSFIIYVKMPLAINSVDLPP
jgi:hypothetical protein